MFLSLPINHYSVHLMFGCSLIFIFWILCKVLRLCMWQPSVYLLCTSRMKVSWAVVKCILHAHRQSSGLEANGSRSGSRGKWNLWNMWQLSGSDNVLCWALQIWSYRCELGRQATQLLQVSHVSHHILVQDFIIVYMHTNFAMWLAIDDQVCSCSCSHSIHLYSYTCKKNQWKYTG